MPEGETYYHIPLNEGEGFLLSRTTKNTPSQFFIKFFKDILTSERPVYSPTHLTMNLDSINPNKIKWMMSVDARPDINTYNMVSKQVADDLIQYSKRNPGFVISGKKTMGSSMIPTQTQSVLLANKILGEIHKSTTKRSADPYAAAVLFLLIVWLGMAVWGRTRRVEKEERPFAEKLKQFIDKIKDDGVRMRLQTIWRENGGRDRGKFLTKFQTKLRDPEFFSALLSFLNDMSNDETVRGIIRSGWKTLPEGKPKKMFQKILGMPRTQPRQMKLQLPSSVAKTTLDVPSQRQPAEKKIISLFQEFPLFWRNNTQLPVSPEGSKSPVFVPILEKFLKKSPERRQLQAFIYQKARQFIKENPAITLGNMNNLLENAITEHSFQNFKRTTGQKPLSFTTPRQQQTLLSQPVFSQQTIPQTSTKPEQQVVFPSQTTPQTSTKSEQPSKPLSSLVKRIKKEGQSQQMTKTMEKNIRLIEDSTHYQELINKLIVFLKDHPETRTILIVDAPNLLFQITKSFAHRQKQTKRQQFLRMLRELGAFPSEKFLLIIVSQKNLRKNNESLVVFSEEKTVHIDNPIFYVRIGCMVQGQEGKSIKNCFQVQAIGSNEMDDFIRHDLMARLVQHFPSHTFLEISNDKGRNWQMI